MKYSQIKQLKAFCESLHSEPAWREVLDNILSDESDFEVDNVRFIDSEHIDEIQTDELESDEYILGCFTDHAIAHATGWPIALIEAAQKGESYEEIGKAMTREHIEALQQYYSSCDGYGHHFNRYDGNEEELWIDGKTYHVFDQH